MFKNRYPKVYLSDGEVAAYNAARKISNTTAPKRGIEVLANISWKEL